MAQTIAAAPITGGENIIADHVFQSDFYQVKNWSFNAMQSSKKGNGYNDCFCLVLVKKGRFLFDTGRQGHVQKIIQSIFY